MSDEQDQAEALDEEVVDDVDDFDGDEYGDGLPEYPPDEPLGVKSVGVTEVEEGSGDSFDERTWREEPDVGEPGARRPARDSNRQIADELGGHEEGPEAGAMHLEE